MSGTEAIAAIQLIDACIGIARAIFDISEAVTDAQGLPRKLRNLCEKLPAIEHLLKTARDSCKEGRVTEDASKSAQPILQQCEQALAELQDIFQKACPQTADNRSKRIWKGGRAVFFGRDSQVQKLLVSVQDNLRILEQREVFFIGDKLDELQRLTEELGHDEASKYTHIGEGHIIANEGGSPANFIMSGSGRQINNPGVYNEGPSTHTHNYISGSNELDRFLAWLSPPDPVDNLKKSLARRSPGTGEWYLRSRQYESWKTSEASFTWLHGSVGSGKTVLSAGIIDNLRDFCNKDTTRFLAFFFFDFHDYRKEDPIYMVKSLICQLLGSFSSLPEAMHSLYASCKDGQWPASDQQLLQALRDSLALRPNTFIVLDALDECNATDRLFDLLEEMQNWRESCLHVLVTSRNIIEMREGLEDLVPIGMRTCLQSQVVDRDIQTYVHRTLLEHRSFKGWQKKWQKGEARDVLDEIEETLRRKAHGMFRWVTCQLDALAGCVNRAMVRRALDELPKDLPETYDRILRNIDKSRAATAAKEILRWVVYAQRQLQTTELLELTGFVIEEGLRFDREEVLGDLDDILRICSSLVSVTTTTPLFNGLWHDAGAQGAREYVGLAHASVRDYLVSDNPSLAHYRLSYQESHEVLASCCLVYLLRLKADEWTTDGFDTIFPLARYAANFWTEHTRISGARSQQQRDLSMELLTRSNSAFRAWSTLGSKGLAEQLPLLAASSEGLTYAVRMILQKGKDDLDAQWYSYNALHAASAEGYEEIVEVLLRQGADVNIPSQRYGANALGIACENGYESIAILLLANGADANAEYGWMEMNALAIACCQGQESLVERMLATDVPRESYRGFGRALREACARGHDKIVRTFACSNALVGVPWEEVDSAMAVAIDHGHYKLVETLLDVNIQGRPDAALCAACRCGDEMFVQKLLDKGNFADASSVELSNGLRAACASGHEGTMEILLARGAGGGNDAFHAACAEGHERIMEILLARGAIGGNDAFRAACAGGDERISRVLLYQINGAGSDALGAACVESQRRVLRTVLARGARVDQFAFPDALEYACSGGYLGTVKALLENDCGVAFLSESRSECLQMACAGGHRSIVEMLLANGASANYTGRYGDSLIIACERGDDKIVEMLLNKGADANGGMRPERRYGNPLQTACEGGHTIIVKMLLEKGADVNRYGGYYGYALHAACVGGHESIVNMLLDYGARVNAFGRPERDEDDWYLVDSLTIACERGHKAIVRILLDKGANVDNHRMRPFSIFWPYDLLPSHNALVAACGRGHEGIVSKILQKTAEVGFEEGNNGTALLAACQGAYEEIVEMLLDKDAKVAIHNAYNDAILAASDATFEGIVEMLLDRAVNCSTTAASHADAMPTGQISPVKRRRLDKGLFPSAAQR